MIEMLMVGKKSSLPLIDVDFSEAAVGSSAITDRSGRVWTRNGSNPGSVVVEDQEKGNVLFLDGKSWYRTDITPDLYLNATEWKLTVEFKTTSAAHAVLLATGDYPRPAGLALSVNQYPATYIQLFLERSGTTYARLMADITNTMVWERVEITSQANKPFTMKIYRENSLVAEKTLARWAFGNGDLTTGMVLGTAAGSPGSQLATCLLKSVKLERL